MKIRACTLKFELRFEDTDWQKTALISLGGAAVRLAHTHTTSHETEHLDRSRHSLQSGRYWLGLPSAAAHHPASHPASGVGTRW